MKDKVYIRVDASPQIGLGHLVRCVALAYMLKKSFNIIFVCKQIPSQVVDEIIDNGFELFQIGQEESFIENIIENDIVILDGYNFDTVYQVKLKQKACKLVCIDDLHDKNFVADLIINHVPGVTQQNYNAQPYTKFLLGLSYALLRPLFLKQAQKKGKSFNNIENVFICFGGSDFKNLTEQCLTLVRKFSGFKKIMVVTGAGYKNSDNLQAHLLQDKRIAHFHAIEEEQMFSILKHTHMAIVPASGILLEVLTFKIPVITGSYVNNQSIFITEMTKYKQVIDSIDFSDVNLTDSINRVFNTKIEYDNIFDGYSGERIAQMFKSI